MRKFIVSVGLLLATVFILVQFSHFEKLMAVLQQGQLSWVVVALILQAGWQIAQVAQFRSTHRLTNVQQSLGEILPVVVANNFLLVAAPTANASTFALFIYDARRRGLSVTRVSLAVMLFAILQNLSHSLAIIAAAFFLIANNSFSLVVALPALILFLFTALFTGAMVLAVYTPGKLMALFVVCVRPLNRLSRRFRQTDLISESGLIKFTSESADDLQSLRRQPTRLWMEAAFFTLGEKLVLGLLMASLFLAFHETPTLSAITVGVSTASLLTVVSPTPMGIGVAEGVITFILIKMGIAAENAIIISLAYRGLTIWLPTLYGFIAFEWSGLRWYNRTSQPRQGNS